MSEEHAIESAPTLQPADMERGEEDKGSMDEKNRNQDGEIDYEKMGRQAIGVTRIETLWRHFGTNRPVLTALGLSIFREYLQSRSLSPPQNKVLTRQEAS
jgi:hypothetical protein